MLPVIAACVTTPYLQFLVIAVSGKMLHPSCADVKLKSRKNSVKTEMRREENLPSSSGHMQSRLFACGHRLDLFDLAAIVGTALRAHSVRQMQRATLGASHETGSRQLPHGAASLIASLLGYFSLRYCHVDTSLVLTA